MQATVQCGGAPETQSATLRNTRCPNVYVAETDGSLFWDVDLARYRSLFPLVNNGQYSNQGCRMNGWCKTHRQGIRVATNLLRFDGKGQILALSLTHVGLMEPDFLHLGRKPTVKQRKPTRKFEISGFKGLKRSWVNVAS